VPPIPAPMIVILRRAKLDMEKPPKRLALFF